MGYECSQMFHKSGARRRRKERFEWEHGIAHLFSSLSPGREAPRPSVPGQPLLRSRLVCGPLRAYSESTHPTASRSLYAPPLVGARTCGSDRGRGAGARMARGLPRRRKHRLIPPHQLLVRRSLAGLASALLPERRFATGNTGPHKSRPPLRARCVRKRFARSQRSAQRVLEQHTMVHSC